MNIETERKYLIKLPDTEFLRSIDGCRVLDMRQTYLVRLQNAPKLERRVRSITENGEVTYVYTEKSPRAYLSRFENEYEISAEKYRTLLFEADTELKKTRYAFPYAGHTMEIDIYPPEIGGAILSGLAILEVELDDPDEAVEFPDFLEILREVTNEREYRNRTLARRVK